MAFYAYILRCADGLYYTGLTEDLERPLDTNGGVGSEIAANKATRADGPSPC